ncbi:hypothetical protein K7472_27910 [Streptomyces sp. PTM05]|uniref:Uncharacterized protein n=1 Tax=Streptantibioticus parmotrematis TaxID=2873249 RepID=A0ABS7QZK6_9ACTN|nr:hypothetical protein [Streptantibioticus parmotrematis]MBY8888640.1 hypothetical protein [Streptantibioticus parmotrematis]
MNLFLTGLEHRAATARDLPGLLGAEACRWVREWDQESLEVVIEGRLVNTHPCEMLLTLRDHEDSGRRIWYTHRNQSVFLLDGEEVDLGHAILRPEQEVSFTWIDRRPREEWVAIHNLHERNRWKDPELELPKLTALETVRAILRRQSSEWARESKVKRSGFRIVCEPRTSQRVATVWSAEVIQPPIRTAGRDEDGAIVFEARKESVTGPLDDRIVHYRADFDPTLALVMTPKRRRLSGRL